MQLLFLVCYRLCWKNVSCITIRLEQEEHRGVLSSPGTTHHWRSDEIINLAQLYLVGSFLQNENGSTGHCSAPLRHTEAIDANTPLHKLLCN